MDWQLHHNIAAAHLSYLVQNFLAKHQISQVLQLLIHQIWPHMTFLFQKVKMLLKGNRLQDMEEMKQNTMMQLLAFPKSQFQKRFRQWKDHRNRCVVSEGD
jgi:hypothetical protein